MSPKRQLGLHRGGRGFYLQRYVWRLVALFVMLLSAVTPAGAQGSCPSPVGRIGALSNPGGTMTVGSGLAFPLPSGIVTTIDGGVVDPYELSQGLTIPPGGFSVPAFCIQGLGFTAAVVATGCQSGSALGEGTGWAAGAPCPDPEVRKVGDTSAEPCSEFCWPGGSGPRDSLGDIDTTRGGAFPGDADLCTVSAPGVHVQLDIPVNVTVWLDATFTCPAADGVYNPGIDTLISTLNFILSPTTDQAAAQFVDKNGDGCALAGTGPDTAVTLVGSPAPGPGCVVGDSITLVAAGLAFSGSSPFYDFRYTMTIPFAITSCDESSPGSDTCTLTTDPCLD
jgi:hypothetical protein